jgi:hypothetical protein
MQSPTEFIARKMLTSSASNKYLERLVTLQRSVIEILESKVPKTDPCGTPEGTGKDKVSKCVQKVADQKGKYVTSLTNRLKDHKHKICEVK